MCRPLWLSHRVQITLLFICRLQFCTYFKGSVPIVKVNAVAPFQQVTRKRKYNFCCIVLGINSVITRVQYWIFYVKRLSFCKHKWLWSKSRVFSWWLSNLMQILLIRFAWGFSCHVTNRSGFAFLIVNKKIFHWCVKNLFKLVCN